MTESKQPPNEAIEDVILSLDGVVSAKINSNDQGEILEVHILTTSERAPKQVVRDVESAVYSTLSYKLDHLKISVAQMKSEDDTSPAIIPASQKRFRFEKMHFNYDSKLKCGVKVELSLNGAYFDGNWEEADTAMNKMRACCRSTLLALEKYLEGKCIFSLEGVKVINVFDEKIVVVNIKVIGNTLFKTLVGSAVVQEDQNRSAVLATLNATNRFMRFLETL